MARRSPFQMLDKILNRQNKTRFIDKVKLHLGIVAILTFVVAFVDVGYNGFFNPSKTTFFNSDASNIFDSEAFIVIIILFYVGYWVASVAIRRTLLIAVPIVMMVAAMFASFALDKESGGNPGFFERILLSITMGFVFMVPYLGGLFRVLVDKDKTKRMTKELEEQNAKSELALLRNQFNPHFIFNTLHNIDTLITKDPALASSAIIKLSEIMRYSTYESGTESIPIHKEIEYLNNYLELQSIRLDNPLLAEFRAEVADPDFPIAPMLLIPFVENAFKHSSDKSTSGAIRIELTSGKGSLLFVCENPAAQRQGASKDASGGIGLANVQRRLMLIYPGAHSLDISCYNNIFKIRMEIWKNEN